VELKEKWCRNRGVVSTETGYDPLIGVVNTMTNLHVAQRAGAVLTRLFHH
jgi:hypothetical protein